MRWVSLSTSYLLFFFSATSFWNLLRKCSQFIYRHTTQNIQVNTFGLNFHFCGCSPLRPGYRVHPILFESALINKYGPSFKIDTVIINILNKLSSQFPQIFRIMSCCSGLSMSERKYHFFLKIK
ncbi:uncharacterized protein BX663DRAFT_290431 [Cokeromyces recurvatus]|uniref:uncharacterized protein n=1 Tax=Cokeromyces recurvatus TaxID=90255 RepID=UPI00221F568D|nr:uncharacterized protein BX663DRAFT_290431 [Cokeromyces recurvatus]KAI7905687.1 hypothetical protein BX663DRAFT_290431 [Cokeromyces recurvatus]